MIAPTCPHCKLAYTNNHDISSCRHHKMKDHCEARRPCNYTDLTYCESCDITLCGRHFK